MPNQRSPNVSDYKLRMPRRLYAAVRQAADERGLSAQEVMRQALEQATGGGRKLLNQKQAAELLGVSDWTLRCYWPSKGLRPPRVMRCGKLVGYDRDDLLAWAVEHRLGKG